MHARFLPLSLVALASLAVGTPLPDGGAPSYPGTPVDPALEAAVTAAQAWVGDVHGCPGGKSYGVFVANSMWNPTDIAGKTKIFQAILGATGQYGGGAQHLNYGKMVMAGGPHITSPGMVLVNLPLTITGSPQWLSRAYATCVGKQKEGGEYGVFFVQTGYVDYRFSYGGSFGMDHVWAIDPKYGNL